MQLTSVLALAPFLGAALAAPSRLQHEKFHANKRDIAWVTVTDEVVETVVQTTTVWVAPGQASPSPAPSPSPPSAPAPAPVPVSPSSAPVVAPSPAPVASSGFVGLQNPTPSPVAPSPVAPSPQSPSPVNSPSPPPAPASSPVPSPVSGGGPAPGVSTLPGASVPDGPCTTDDPCKGDATFYQVGVGACGGTNVESDMVVAVPQQMFGTFTNTGADGDKNALCGRTLQITLIEGISKEATVVDRCAGCISAQDLDMSQGLFTALGGDTGTGRYTNMTWFWTS